MLLSVMLFCIILGCLFWVYRLLGENTKAFGKQTVFNKIEIVLFLMLVCSVVSFVAISATSHISDKQLKAELLDIHIFYDNNIMMDDSTDNYLIWMPPYDSTSQFMSSTETLLGRRLEKYNEKIWNKQKAQQNSFYGEAIKLSVKPIIMIEDPTSIAWIEQ